MFCHVATLLIIVSALSVEADSFDLRQSKLNDRNVVVAEIQLKAGGPKLELYWKKEDGAALKTFEELERWLETKSKKSLLRISRWLKKALWKPANVWIRRFDGRASP